MGLGIIFSGQGNQSLDMFSKHAPDLQQQNLQLAADKLKLNVLPQINLNESQLFANQHAQPLIATYEWLIWDYLKKYLPEPVAMAGYSLGEVTAVACAGEFSLAELIETTQVRAHLMTDNSNVTSGLLAVSGVDIERLTTLCHANNCYIAIINSPCNVIIGGYHDQLATCHHQLQQLAGQINLQWLKVDVPSHTPLLTQASEKFATYLEKYDAKKLHYRVVSGINADVQYDMTQALIDLSMQVKQTIIFNRVIKVLSELGVDVLLEIGPGKALAHIVQQQNLPILVKSIDDFKRLADIPVWINKQVSS